MNGKVTKNELFDVVLIKFLDILDVCPYGRFRIIMQRVLGVRIRDLKKIKWTHR
jgi:hypothetical protein